ncbi:hypothetical protein MIPYR_10682 [uncultured Microbacterium sp.]|uniref:Uncharacterized protein n=1 Tax=uncultured Microbacterium sp. TaxID=191216 RepID=A0A1Y5P4G7_9MICO|nr:hypothetical protein MIPYR_10682 [uncultured Microbacterium sp.]
MVRRVSLAYGDRELCFRTKTSQSHKDKRSRALHRRKTGVKWFTQLCAPVAVRKRSRSAPSSCWTASRRRSATRSSCPPSSSSTATP